MGKDLKFNDEDYIRFDPFDGEEAAIACRTVKLVQARKERPCFIGATPGKDGHSILPGNLYRSERALVDGDYWGNYAVCIPCMDEWLTEVGRQPRKEAA